MKREYLKKLRNESDEKLIEKINKYQQEYNKWFDLYEYNKKDNMVNYMLDTYLTNMEKVKKVLKERNIKIVFSNGWELV